MSTIPALAAEAETIYTPGPGQNIAAPKRGRGEIWEQSLELGLSFVKVCLLSIKFLTSKAEFFCTPIIYLMNFINKKVGNRKN